MELSQSAPEELDFRRTYFETLKEQADSPEILELARELARKLLEGEEIRL